MLKTQPNSDSIKAEQLVRCIECNELALLPDLEQNQHANCPRCGHILRNGGRWSLRRCSIIALAILILMPFALKFPLLSIDLLGTKVEASVWEGVWKMAIQGYPYTAFLIFICAIFMPIAFPLVVILLRIAQLFHYRPRNLLWSLNILKPWVMFDVYLIALAVSAFKVREYASLSFDIYLIAFVLTALLTTLLFIKINPHALWRDFYPDLPTLEQIKPDQRSQVQICSACHYSYMSNMVETDQHKQHCPRCYNVVNAPDFSLQRTWATLIAGIIMLFPANLLPMSVVYLNGAPTADTLMSGVLSFMNMGSYAIAFIVFVASIFVPVSKVLIMLYLLICIQFKRKGSIALQMKLLHIVHFVGRWSMLDLFVLALMMSLVSRVQIIDFSVGPAAFYFGAAVFLTMISTSQFDSRLLWKIYDKQ